MFVTKENELSVWNRTPQWVHLRVWESSERGVGIICRVIQHEKGKEGETKREGGFQEFSYI